MVLIILILVSMSIGVVYFHGVDVKRLKDLSDKYNKDWFLRNNESTAPPDIFKYIKTPPIENLPPPEDVVSMLNLSFIHFIIEGRVPFLAWRYLVFDTYTVNMGWMFGSESYSSYFGESRGFLRFKVIKPLYAVNYSGEVDLVTLWQVEYGVEASGFTPTESNASNFVFSPRLSDPNERLYVYVSADSPFRLGVKYFVYGSFINEDDVASVSSDRGYLRNYISRHPDLERFIELPAGYFEMYPEVWSVIESLNVSESSTIYETVSYVISYFLMNYNITFEQFETEEDPVALFIINGGGSVVAYIYTVAFVLRALDIPTRVILGYVGGYYNGTEDVTYLRTADLMLWIEVFDPGAGGWVPYNCLPFGVDVMNLVETGFSFYAFVDAPRYIQGIPAVYINESFTIVFMISGAGAQYLTGNVTFIDYNESAILGTSSLVASGPQESSASLTTSFESFYSMLGRDPTYGLHIILITYKQLKFFVLVALMRKVSITP